MWVSGCYYYFGLESAVEVDASFLRTFTATKCPVAFSSARNTCKHTENIMNTATAAGQQLYKHPQSMNSIKQSSHQNVS